VSNQRLKTLTHKRSAYFHKLTNALDKGNTKLWKHYGIKINIIDKIIRRELA